MASKGDIRKLIKKGLTGREAGRLVLEDSWEVDHGREGFLSSADIQAIKSVVVKSQREADIYNRYVETYRLVATTLREAHIIALQVRLHLKTASDYLWRYWLDTYAFWLRESRIPVIVTEKQYQEEYLAIQARQREQKLKELLTLEEILDRRVDTLAPESWFDEWEQAEEALGDKAPDEYTYLRTVHPEVYPQAVDSLLELIRAGQLGLVQLLPRDVTKLKRLAEKLSAKRAKDRIPDETYEAMAERLARGQFHPPGWTDDDQEELEALVQEEKALTREAFERAKPQAGQQTDRLVASLEQYKAGSLDEKAESRLLSYTLCLQEDLYQAGLPEWIDWVDTYEPGLYERELRGQGVAIIKDPAPHQVDERGYFKQDYWEWLDDLAFVRAIDEHIKKGGHQEGLAGTLKVVVEMAKNDLRDFLAFQAVIATVSEVVGIDFTEDLKRWYQEIESEVGYYNSLAKDKRPTYRRVTVPVLRLSMYKPTPSEVQYLRERMAISLGNDWWTELCKRVEIQQKTTFDEAGEDKEVDFGPPEPELWEEVPDGQD